MKDKILTLRQHPSWLRESEGRNGEYPVNWKIFEGILRDFSQLQIYGELYDECKEDFKDDLLRNDPPTVVDFIDRSIEIPQLHPVVYIILFEVLKFLREQLKITYEKHTSICKKLLSEEREEIIARRYDINKFKANLIMIDCN